MVTTIYGGAVLDDWEVELLNVWLLNDQGHEFQRKPIFVEQDFSRSN